MPRGDEMIIGQILGRLDSLHEDVIEIKTDQKEILNKVINNSSEIKIIKTKVNGGKSNGIGRKDYAIFGVIAGVAYAVIEAVRTIMQLFGGG